MEHMTEKQIRTTDFTNMVKAQEITKRRCHPALRKVAIDFCVDLCNVYTGTFKTLDSGKGGSL